MTDIVDNNDIVDDNSPFMQEQLLQGSKMVIEAIDNGKWEDDEIPRIIDLAMDCCMLNPKVHLIQLLRYCEYIKSDQLILLKQLTSLE